MTRTERRARSRVHRSVWAGTHTRHLRNVATPANPGHPVQEVRVEHGGVYVLSHLPRHGDSTNVGPNLHRLNRAAEDIRELLADRYRSRVTAALVVPTDPAHPDVAASVHGVLVLDAASLARAAQWATPALSTSEVSAVETLLRRQLPPQTSPAAARRRRWRRLPRLRSAQLPLRATA
jgi:hypothetical protein